MVIKKTSIARKSLAKKVRGGTKRKTALGSPARKTANGRVMKPASKARSR